MAPKVNATAVKVSKTVGKASPKNKAMGKPKIQVKAATKSTKGDKKALAAEKALGNNQTPTKTVKDDLETPEKEAKAANVGGVLKKVLDEAAGKSVKEAMAEHRQRLHRIDATIAEAAALEEAQAAQVVAAKKEIEQASAAVRALEEEEKNFFEKQSNLKKARADAAAKTEQRHKELQEAQRTLGAVEVMSKGSRKLQDAAKEKTAASELALAAKEKQKEALAATKAAIAQVTAMKGRGKGRGKKRASNTSDAKSPAGTASKKPKAAPEPTKADAADKADAAQEPAPLHEADHDIQ